MIHLAIEEGGKSKIIESDDGIDYYSSLFLYVQNKYGKRYIFFIIIFSEYTDINIWKNNRTYFLCWLNKS